MLLEYLYIHTSIICSSVRSTREGLLDEHVWKRVFEGFLSWMVEASLVRIGWCRWSGSVACEMRLTSLHAARLLTREVGHNRTCHVTRGSAARWTLGSFDILLLQQFCRGSDLMMQSVGGLTWLVGG